MTLSALIALLPQLILALGATAVLLIGAWLPMKRGWHYVGALLALVAALLSATLQPTTLEVAGLYTTAPYARFCSVLWSLTIAATLFGSGRYSEKRRFGGSEYASLLLFAAAGMNLLSMAISLVGLFLALEAFTLVLYILIAFNRDCNRGAEAGLKYLVFGGIATAFLSFGIALIYTASGTFMIADAFHALRAGHDLTPLGLAGWAMMLVAIGFKISLVPFHLWTPDVYQGAPAPISGVLATAAKGAVLTAFLPLLTILGESGETVRQIVWLLALATMLGGTLTALVQTNLKRMLGYSSVVQMGYLLLALLVGGADGGKALLYYLVIYTVSTFGAFAVITSLAQDSHELQDYEELAGLGYRYPKRAIVLAACMFSLAGIPPLAGFFAKFILFRTAFAHQYSGLAVVAIFVSLVSVYYYLRPVVTLFMGKDENRINCSGSLDESLLLGVCCVVLILFGIFPEPLVALVASVFQ